MIEVNDLTRYYGQKRAISNVSFKVKKGEILGMLGPNAAGKTTLFKILLLISPLLSKTRQTDKYGRTCHFYLLCTTAYTLH